MRYDMETIYFDEGVRNAKRRHLESKTLDLVHPAYVTLLEHLYSISLEHFKSKLDESLKNGEGFAVLVRTCTKSCMAEFDKGSKDAAILQANWDASKVRDNLRNAIESHAASTRSTKLSEIASEYEKQLAEKLTEPVESLLEACAVDTWPSIRKLLKHETEIAVSEFTAALSTFELDQGTTDAMVQKLREYARNLVEKKAKKEAGKVLMRMKDRFSTVFNHDNESMPRVWTGKEDIRTITKDARSASLKLLSVMAALRLQEKEDNTENVLQSSLVEREIGRPSSQTKSIDYTSDPPVSSTWEEVSPKETLITPVQCKSIWRQFKAETEYAVTQAISAQEAYKQSNNWLPPPWAIAAMVILGFNEFMLLLKNPLYLLGLFVIYLLSKAMWVQMDIGGEFRHGALAGILSISSKFLPTVMNLLRRLAEEAQGTQTHQDPQTHQAPRLQLLSSQSFRSQSQRTSTPSVVTESSASSTLSSMDDSVEYSSPNLAHRRGTVAAET